MGNCVKRPSPCPGICVVIVDATIDSINLHTYKKRNRPVIMLISFTVTFMFAAFHVAGTAYIKHRQQGWNN